MNAFYLGVSSGLMLAVIVDLSGSLPGLVLRLFDAWSAKEEKKKKEV